MDDSRRRRRWGWAAATTVLYAATAAAALLRADEVNSVGGYDVIRAVVLAEAAVVVVLYVAAALRAIHCSVRARERWDRTAWRGRYCLLLAVLVLLYDEVVRVWHRLGAESFNPRTPTLQVALWLLLVAYIWVIRRFWRTDARIEDAIRGGHP